MDKKVVTGDLLNEDLDGFQAHHPQPLAPLRREIDSLDDFEHLGHDSSPLEGFRTHPPVPSELGPINNKGPETGATVANLSTSLSSTTFDPFGAINPPLFDNKMDSNLLEMGDHFPDRKEADDKLDKFLQDMSTFAPPVTKPQDLVPHDDIKSATQDFMVSERINEPKSAHEELERYSDSEPDDEDDFKPVSKYEDFPKKAELPESFETAVAVEQHSFKDVEEFHEPQLPKKDYPTLEPVKVQPTLVVERVQDVVSSEANITSKECPKKGSAIDAEAIFCRMGLDTWFNPDRLNPKVESLIYWRDPKKSGPVFGGVLLVLLSLTYFSLISVVAYLSLLALTGTISFRIYKNVVQAVQKTGEGHPFKTFLEFDVALPQEKVKEVSEVAVAHINAGVSELRRLFLVEDLVDSIKFGVLLWTLTYLGAWFNGMTLIIIGWVALFSLPKVYETNKTQIDANLEIVRTKLADITSKVKAAIPIGKKVEEKKEQ